MVSALETWTRTIGEDYKMPKVTDLQYQMEGFLIEKLDSVVQRVTTRKLDCILMIDGDEGFGKTGISILAAHYLSWKTGREFSLNNVFFDPKELVNFINTTKKQLIIWDEAALGGLASGWQNKVQQLIIQTLMTCRSRQHIIIFNVPKFYRLNRYFVSDRADGLIHVYSEDKINAGRFTYYKKEWLEKMLEYYSFKKVKPYKKFYSVRLRGKFIDAFKVNIVSEEAYDTKKEANTEKLLAQYGDDRKNDKLLRLQHQVATKLPLERQQISELFKVRPGTITEWKKIPIKYPEIFKEIA